MSNHHRFSHLPKLLVVCAVLVAGRAALADVPDAVSYPNAWMNITPGANASRVEFSWATKSSDLTAFTYGQLDDILSTAPITENLPVPQVQIVKLLPGQDLASVSFDGNPVARTFQGVTLKSYVTQSGTTSAAGWYQNKVTVSGLERSSVYAYRVGYGTTWSGPYAFRTADPRAFTLIAVGDPQIGANTGGIHEPPAQVGNVLPYDIATWKSSVTAMTGAIPDAAFVLSLGDQIDNTSSQAGADAQYDGYFSPLELLGIPVATVDGNHDYGLGQYYGYHYNLPNQSLQYGATQYGNDGDYWFRYGSALFLMLNSNTLSASTHDVFLHSAIAANRDASWRIVCFHHALFSIADHGFDTDILFRRTAYSAIFDKHHIDVVLAGHDHSFTRSFQLEGGVPVSKEKMRTEKDGTVTVRDPEGTLYMTLNSGSGSKFYDLNSAYIDPVTGVVTYPVFVANFWQGYLPSFSRVAIDDDSFSIVTYALGGSTSPIDSYRIVKRGW